MVWWFTLLSIGLSGIGLGYGLRTTVFHKGHGRRPFAPCPAEVFTEPFVFFAAFIISILECFALLSYEDDSYVAIHRNEFFSCLFAAAAWLAVFAATLSIVYRNDPDWDLPLASLPHLRRPTSAHCVLMTRRRMYPFRVWASLQGVVFVVATWWMGPASVLLPGSSDSQALYIARYGAAVVAGIATSYRLLACSAAAATGSRTVYEGKDAIHRPWEGPHPQDHLPLPEKVAADRNLRILIVTLGTRGDVQPFVGLAKRLQEAGHTPVIATTTDFKDFIESHGIEYGNLGLGRIRQTTDWVKVTSIDKMIESSVKDIASDYFPIAEGFDLAVREPTRADLILCTAITLSFGLDLSEAYDIPCWACKLAPDGFTSAFAPGDSKTSTVGTFNFLKHVGYWGRVAKAASRGSDLTALENQFRKTLDLPAVGVKRLKEMFYHPVLYCFSPAIVPKPIDWPDWFFTVGFVFLNDAPTFHPAEELLAFLENGGYGESDPVVCVNFGSMIHASNCGIVERCVEAVISEGYKCLVVSGWSKTPPELQKFSKKLLVIKEAPHDWLFPRCAAIIHHGGAGTAARVAASGVPGIVVPVLKWADQATWGELYEKAHVGAIVHPGTSATVAELRKAVQRVFSTPSMHSAAQRVAKTLVAEDGCDTVVTMLQSSLAEQILTPHEYHELLGKIALNKPLKAMKLSSKQEMCYRHCLHIRELRDEARRQWENGANK